MLATTITKDFRSSISCWKQVPLRWGLGAGCRHAAAWRGAAQGRASCCELSTAAQLAASLLYSAVTVASRNSAMTVFFATIFAK